MRIDILTLFPEMFEGVFTQSIIKRAIAKGHLELHTHNIRDYSKEESMLYGKYLSPACFFAGSSDLTMAACYEKLRELSLFTHRIALPQLKSYTISARPAGSETPFLLIPSDNV